MTPFRASAAVAAMLFALLLAACASAPKTPAASADANLGPWSGRLALQVQDQPTESFAAAFELKGNPQRGELTLSSPLGGTLGVLQWEPGGAVLHSGSRSRRYDSVDELVTQVAGSPIPVAALFDWLRGIATAVPGWKPELAQLASGRISAHRFTPGPEADLRVILER